MHGNRFRKNSNYSEQSSMLSSSSRSANFTHSNHHSCVHTHMYVYNHFYSIIKHIVYDGRGGFVEILEDMKFLGKGCKPYFEIQ